MKLFLALVLLLPLSASAQDDSSGKKSEIEFELDPYYTSVGWYRALTSKPIPNLGQKKEWEIYAELLKKFYLPRTLVLELSVNPLPCAGVYLKKHASDFYNSFNAGGGNLVESLTTGFEEPWAASLFLGNVMEHDSIKKAYLGKRHSYSGFLLSAGNFHIKQNRLVQDNWLETEIKLKGEQILAERSLRWSFRVGHKHHANRGIADAFYLGVRRSRTDFKEKGNPFINNTGIEYVFDFSRETLRPLRHLLVVDKKFPLKNRRLAFWLGVGVMWTSGGKYSGALAETGKTGSQTAFLIRPNIEF